MRAIRTASLCIALIAAGAIYGADAEYLSGTVKSIPSNMTGKLDVSDPNDLIFAYGKGVYRLPFERIKSFEWEHAKAATRRVFGRVQVPHLPWGKQEDVLNLSFRGEDHAIGVLSFKVNGKDLSTTEWALKSRIADPQGVATAGRTKLPESWWGDRYWRTNRNAVAWPSNEPEAAGTK
ncbi:MAG: hypothetical protein ACR2NN_14525 [Bryobacteraceae bacterium]